LFVISERLRSWTKQNSELSIDPSGGRNEKDSAETTCRRPRRVDAARLRGPLFFIPGGRLEAEVGTKPVTDGSFVTERFVELETRLADPYSVLVEYIVKDGILYIDPAEGRRWRDDIHADPQVKIRFGTKVYLRTAVLVGSPGQLEEFSESRYTDRLDPRENE